MLDHRQLSVACRFGLASKEDIESYIQSVEESGEEYDKRLFEAYSNDQTVARTKMLEFFDFTFPEFRINWRA